MQTPVITFGEALIDMLALPGANGRTLFQANPGGAPANVAVGVAKLGGQAKFVGQVGNDLFGRQINKAMQVAGVDTQQLGQTPYAMTPLAFVQLDEHGERSFAFYRDRSADLIYQAEQCEDDVFSQGGVFHTCSNTLTHSHILDQHWKLLTRARAAACLLSFDVNYRPNLWATGTDSATRIWQVMMACDVVKASAGELKNLYGSTSQAIDRLLACGVQLVLITDGADPVRARWAHGELQVTPPKVKAVDTTAAGDSFMAGFLFHLAMHAYTTERLRTFLNTPNALADAMSFACACGAHTVQHTGAFDALPFLGDLQ